MSQFPEEQVHRAVTQMEAGGTAEEILLDFWPAGPGSPPIVEPDHLPHPVFNAR